MSARYICVSPPPAAVSLSMPMGSSIAIGAAGISVGSIMGAGGAAGRRAARRAGARLAVDFFAVDFFVERAAFFAVVLRPPRALLFFRAGEEDFRFFDFFAAFFLAIGPPRVGWVIPITVEHREIANSFRHRAPEISLAQLTPGRAGGGMSKLSVTSGFAPVWLI